MNTNNEETIFLSEYLDGLKKTEKKIDIKTVWKPVSLGGVSAIMLSVGAYALGNMGRDLFHVDNEKSFEEALDEVREELGSDGVFQYKDGVYVACSPEEWEEKSDVEKATVVSHLVPEEFLDVDLTSVESNGQSERVIAVDVNENINPTDVDVQASVETNEPENVEVSASVADESVRMVASDVEQVSDDPDVVMVSSDTDNEFLNEEFEVTLMDDDASVDEEKSVVGKIIEEIAELIVPEARESHPAPLEASKAIDVDVDSSDNPEVAPDMPDYMQDADLSSIF